MSVHLTPSARRVLAVLSDRLVHRREDLGVRLNVTDVLVDMGYIVETMGLRGIMWCHITEKGLEIARERTNG